MRIFLKALAGICCIALLMCGCSTSEEERIKVPTGTYCATRPDNTVTEIILTDKTITINNSEFLHCNELATIERVFSERADAAAEGLKLTEEDEKKIADECMAIDFKKYNGVPLSYRIADTGENECNIHTFDEEGEKIWGLFMTYYGNDGTIGFEEFYYKPV